MQLVLLLSADTTHRAAQRGGHANVSFQAVIEPLVKLVENGNLDVDQKG
jgi:hypothetical protein